ncbi:MAG TPA: DUF192 domain-containing protein [Rhodothermales bacterium]|nr:DUF192 domain-containing protein [Rhodothermales bacterium]
MRYLLLLLCLVLLAACESEPQPALPRDIPFRADGTLDFVHPDGSVIRTIDVEIATSDSAWARGLMDRRSLTLGQGMLFLFPEAEMKSFWMKNTPIPLDIMFVASDSQIVNIAKRTPPLSQEQILSTDSAQFVVEVRGGFSDRFGITDSTRIRWQRSE